MQAVSDIFLGWGRAIGLEGSHHHRREESVTYREMGDAAWC
jgi:hypothetical protein